MQKTFLHYDYCFFKDHSLKVTKRFLVLSSTDWGDSKSITVLNLAELTKAELNSSKILSQVYNRSSVMAGHCERVQSLLQERQNKTICM